MVHTGPGNADPPTTTDTVDRMVPQRHAAPGQYLGVIIDLRAVRAVVLPGTGSDDDYITRAFGGPLRDAGAALLAPRPQPTRLIDGYLSALDDAGREGPIVVGGVSIGAAVAVAWALRPAACRSRGAGKCCKARSAKRVCTFLCTTSDGSATSARLTTYWPLGRRPRQKRLRMQEPETSYSVPSAQVRSMRSFRQRSTRSLARA